MAHKNVEVLRAKDNRGSVDKNAESVARVKSDVDDTLEAAGDDGNIIPDIHDEEAGDPGVPTEDELREQRYEEIDNTEISDTEKTSALYRRAVSDFDPEENEVQLAEHYVYTDAELEEHGYF